MSDDTTLPKVGESRYPAAAALALHGQEFGFTRHDVRMLREVFCCAPHQALCANLADRIAALLPPENMDPE